MDRRKICRNCAHFWRHYVKDNYGRFLELDWGHCPFPRAKGKEITDSCKYFKEKVEFIDVLKDF
jgi:hypothetical protein